MSAKYKIFFITLALALVTTLWRAQMRPTPDVVQVEPDLFKAGEFQKSPNDNNQYQRLTLNNGLRVLLISDPETDKAAAALNVGVGYFQDPEDWAGMAHFLEHMLFLGTEPYPNPGEYKDFISQHGGSHNAYTTHENTNYYFDIHPNYFEPALKRFAAFFTKPLFNEELVEREVNAVDSEFQASFKDDGRRIYSTIKRVLNSQHPFTQFSTGNRVSLKADQPEQLRQAVIDFYQRYYHPQRMTLVVIDKEPLARLKQWVTDAFDTDTQQPFEPIEPILTPLITDDRLPLDLEIQPIDQRKVLTLLFPLSETYGDHPSKALEWVEHLLNQTGPGSLEDAFKERGWALNLSSGQAFALRRGSFFSIEVQLTALGESHRDEITAQIFALIKLIKTKGLEAWRYEELKRQAELAFTYRNRQNSLNLASTLAHRMQVYPDLNQLISLPYYYGGIDQARVLNLLQQLSADNLIRLWISPNAVGQQQEPLYQVTYSETKANSQLWKDVSLWPQIALEEPNPFIAKSHKTVLEAEGVATDTSTTPQRLDKSPLYHWHASDLSFKTPRANVFIDLAQEDAIHATPTQLAQHYLISRLVEEAISKQLTQAATAGIYGSIHGHDLGLEIKIRGYFAKVPLLLEYMLNAIKDAPLSAQRFIDIKQRVIENLEDSAKRRPYRQAFEKLEQRLLPNRYDETTLIAALKNLSLEAVQAYRKHWLQGLKGTVLTQGYLDQKDALAIAHLIQKTLPIALGPVERPALHRLETHEQIQWSADHSDTVVLRYQQAPNPILATEDARMQQRVAWAILGRMIEPVFFEQIRTQEQLGYIVSASPRPLLRQPGLYFLVQSPRATATQLDVRIQRFIQDYQQIFDNLSDMSIQKHKEGLANDLREKPKSLSEKGQQYWTSLMDQRPFNEREQLAQAAEQLTKTDIKQALDDILTARSRALTIKTSASIEASTANIPSSATKFNSAATKLNSTATSDKIQAVSSQ
jgi:insulysin